MFKVFLFIVVILLLWYAYYFFSIKTAKQHITWGVNFSQAHAEFLKLDWKKTYLATLEDLGAKHIKLLTSWDWVEGKKDDFYFNDIDWQVSQAEKHNTKVIYVVGMKTGRWPECHLPTWAKALSKEEQQAELLTYIEKVVLRYKKSTSIVAWQVENEPLFRFGECPWYDKDFLRKEIALVKSLDAARPVIVSDSGEYSLWISAAKLGDIVSTTLYRKVWVHLTDRYGFYMDALFPPMSYWVKVQMIEKIFDKKVINGELQAEPWVRDVFADISLEEQEKTMSLNQFKKNIAYARKTGLDTFYFWGSEWWYWMKEKHNKPEIWNEAKGLFQSQ